MIFSILWINTVPGNRESGIAHLQKWAQIVKDEFNSDCGILTNVTSGSPYLAGVVTAHDNMAAMVSNIDAQASSDQFQKWNEESQGTLDWASSEMQTFRQLGQVSEPFPNFGFFVAANIKPGHLGAGREFMAKVAAHIEATHGIATGVYCLEGGSHYRHTWAFGFDNLDQYEAFGTALESDEVWIKYSEDMIEHFDNATLEKNIGRYV